MKNNTQNGYAILFAVVIVSVISMIAIGLSNTTYKQLILSSVAKDSQVSFFQSDTATECALYADNVEGMTATTLSPWNCGVDENNVDYSLDVKALSSGADGYEVSPTTPNATTSCFDFSVEKTLPINPGDPTTTIKGRGYNSCDKNNPKTVEREIQVTY